MYIVSEGSGKKTVCKPGTNSVVLITGGRKGWAGVDGRGVCFRFSLTCIEYNLMSVND